MISRIIRAPVRVDLGGGTLDIWPISAIIPNAVTLNCTLSDGITIKIEQISGPSTVVNADTGLIGQIHSTHPDLSLSVAAMRFFGPLTEQGFKVTVHSSVPRGSGLGTSSVILAALLSGLSEALEIKLTPMEIVRTATDIEARIIACPTGVQDYIAPLFGGMNCIRFPAGTLSVNPIPIPDGLRDRMVLIFTGICHFSGAPNWEMVKGFLDSSQIRSAFYQLADIGNAAVNAAIEGNVDSLARHMREDYNVRKSLPVSLLPQTENLFSFLENSPLVAGFRMCGAAGGGTVAAIATEGSSDFLKTEATDLGYQVLELKPKSGGITIDA
jgi:D-glycero-alpha-D-manno-heptose-7-phosphate kinase